jgi:predicted nucleic acid-binding protein
MAGHVRYTAVIDACVFYGMLKTDVLMSLCVRGLFAAKWSERIENEWVGHLSKNLPDKQVEIIQRRDQMRASVPDWAVDDAAIGTLDPVLQLPDMDDRHVLAAAIVGHADCIVTEDTRGFGDEIVSQYGIEVIDTDTFIINQMDLDEYQALAALKAMRQRWKNPKATPEDFCDAFEKNKLLLTAQRLRERIELI